MLDPFHIAYAGYPVQISSKTCSQTTIKVAIDDFDTPLILRE